ncbi:MAG: prepilin-type N-terminal cleavage/methylation domain-containing protein [Acidobacteriia bacterium]|nr:prepilin-type N-terminal cleavage/methylation domain-containing protein [Terriglobia bacterium]
MTKNQQGVSLIEAMIAVLMSMIVMTSLGGVVFMSTVQNKNQGVEMSRVTVYAQDKIETLMNLDWYDCTQATPVAGCNTTGITGTAWNQGLRTGGTLDSTSGCPSSGTTVGYIDFLDAAGNQFSGADCSAVGTFAYQRQWQITDVITSGAGAPGLKRIDVQVWSRNAVNTGSAAPSAMLTTFVSE